MKDIFVVSDNIFSPLGLTTAENFSRLKAGVSAVRRHDRPEMADEPFYAALFDGGVDASGPYTAATTGAPGDFSSPVAYTKFEQLLLASISDVLKTGDVDPGDPRTILILSTTKGNISLLETEAVGAGGIGRVGRAAANPALDRRIALSTSARLIADHFHFANTPVVISNACISGILALVTAMRLIRSGSYNMAVVAGADVISKFVLSGFGSFQAISPGPCRPFDRSRDGINLGEGAGTVVLSSREKYRGGVRLRGGAVGNDANHISGPSRTGQELCQVINKSLAEAGLTPGDIGFISAHGTATLYNDEMEAKAITLAGLQSVPVNSLKAYYGHTLGAAGLIESIVTLQSMREHLVLPSLGFADNGVSMPLNICSSLLHTSLNNCLKTASGFGGCNAAVVMSQ
jgi:3-oxoacyl-[acyl-carrier-protein] synthase-1